ncbi:phage recombination protein Bet [Bartonella sp. WD16.2]|uniref:phage recombination protein Bet n=1 Tax=Bartonella sp. WD16.2 TaxID=1933904 RepID=UPI00099B1442|nr:phage recombination protein Bet [Bartonella sp. WD16.2]AQX20196.1 phage recombination protein Bet [Bartonella sp. WD16.2]
MTTSLIATVAQKYSFSEQEFRKNVINNCINFNISEEDFVFFIYLANEYGLNPLKKEIYAIKKYGGGIIPIVGIDGWIKIIHSHDNFDGMTFQDQLDNDGKLIATTCTVYLKDKKHPVEVAEYLKECKQNTKPWNEYPFRMLRHKAVAQCARYAFGLSGIYDEDEAARINEANHNPQNERVSDESLAQIKELIQQTKTEEAKVLSFAKVLSLTEMSHEKGQIILEHLKDRQRSQVEEEQQALPSPKPQHTPTQQNLPEV